MEILTGIQRRILDVVRTVPDRERFYLAGGTALSAFYLQHRMSHDIDLFSGVGELIGPFSRGLEASLTGAGFGVERTRGYESFVELTVGDGEQGTIVHLAQESPFLLESVVPAVAYPGLFVGSLPDIASSKLLAMFGRAMVRDFIDVFFLTKERFAKKDLCNLAVKKDPGFDLYWLGVAMERIDTFPDDAPDMHMMVKPCSMGEMKAYFKEWRMAIAREIAGG